MDDWKAEKQKLNDALAECLGNRPERPPLNSCILRVGDLSPDKGLRAVKTEKLYFYSEDALKGNS